MVSFRVRRGVTCVPGQRVAKYVDSTINAGAGADARRVAARAPFGAITCQHREGLPMGARKRVALVTGGMGGLGEAICVKLAALGYAVVTTCSPDNTRAERWLREMRERGYDFHACACDVADWDSCVACVGKVVAEVGPVDVLINNAGITRDMT